MTPRSGNETANGDGKKSPEELYPEANEEEAQLLVSLDEILENPNVQVDVPRIPVKEIDISSGPKEFLLDLLIPTILLGVLAVASEWMSKNAREKLFLIPYAAALLSLCSVLLPTRNRFRQQTETKTEIMKTTTRPVAKEAIEHVVLDVAQKIDLVNMRLSLVVDLMRPKFAKAKQNERELHKMDPNLQIPDPTSLIKELEGAKDEVNASIEFMQKQDLKIEPPFEKKAPTDSLIAFFLTMHLLANHGLFEIFPDDYIVEEQYGRKGSSDSMATHGWPFPLVFVLVAYLLVIVELISIYSMTSAQATADSIDRSRGKVAQTTYGILKQHGIVFLCQDILETRMGRVKSNLQKMISQLYKIDMLMADIQTSPPSSPSSKISRFFSTSPKSSPLNQSSSHSNN